MVKLSFGHMEALWGQMTRIGVNWRTSGVNAMHNRVLHRSIRRHRCGKSGEFLEQCSEWVLGHRMGKLGLGEASLVSMPLT